MVNSQPAQSLEYVVIGPVESLIPELSNPDLTGNSIAFQFVIGGMPKRRDPDPDAWTDGIWVNSNGQLLAAILVGPGGTVTLAKGTYAIWIRIGDDPSVVVELVDQITID